MRNERYTIESVTFTRVSKKKAFDLFNKGEYLILAPCKINLYSEFGKSYIHLIDKKLCDDLMAMVNAFEYYNCNNECGNYTKFFIVEG